MAGIKPGPRSGKRSQVTSATEPAAPPSPDPVNFETHLPLRSRIAVHIRAEQGRRPGSFLPVLVPFVDRRTALDAEALRQLVTRIAAFIFAEMSAVLRTPRVISPCLTAFLETLRQEYTVSHLYNQLRQFLASGSA